MARRKFRREWSMEEYEAWRAADGKSKDLLGAAGEVGGPTLSLVPAPPTMAVPQDGEALDGDIAFEPEPSRLRHGWSAYRQKKFILALSETGSVHRAAKEAWMSARSAYALRVRSRPFREAWDTAQQLAVGRLSALAFDRAINGRPEQVYEDGVLVAERRVPNDRLLMWLLARLDPKRFAMPWEQRAEAADPQAAAATAFEGQLHAIEDVEPHDIMPVYECEDC